jgi:hypothetical protein
MVTVHLARTSYRTNYSTKYMPATSRYTSVPVRASTLHALRAYRVGGKSYDGIILDFIGANPPTTFWTEIERRSKQPDLTLEENPHKLGL